MNKNKKSELRVIKLGSRYHIGVIYYRKDGTVKYIKTFLASGDSERELKLSLSEALKATRKKAIEY